MIDICIVFVLGFLPAIILHEVAHGLVAYWCGDSTAKNVGRLTLNPIAHVDPIGSVVLPLVLLAINFIGLMTVPIFAWAKPVPVNYFRLNNPKRDMMLVGIAGPVVNILIAFVFMQVWKTGLIPFVDNVVSFFGIAMPAALWVVFINVGLAVFNMIPIPPLDGSRLLAWILPEELAIHYRKLERYGILIVIGLLYLGILRQIILPIVLLIVQLLGA